MCNLLAWWTGKDAERIDRIFRQSCLYRQKWERDDYRETAIQNAIDSCRGGYDPEEYRREQEQRELSAAISSDGKPHLVRASDIPYEPPRWVFAPYFQRGKGTLIQGDAGAGKTAFMMGIAAHITTGAPLLGMKIEAPGDVLILSVEDDLPILRGRLEANGADLTKCHFMTNAAGLTFNSPEVETAVKETQARLILFDPFQAFLGAKVDMSQSNETRPQLARLFEKCDTSIYRRLTKDEGKGNP